MVDVRGSRLLREVLAILIWLAWGAAWLLQKTLALVLAILLWLIVGYVRVRHGREAAEDLRRSAAESEGAGRAWRRPVNRGS
jgi:hypothetical protein